MKGRSLIVVQSSGVWIVCILHILLELYMREKKKERKKNDKIKIFVCDFLDCEEKDWNCEAIFYIRIAKGFHL